MRLDPITLTVDCTDQGECSSYAVLQKSEDAIKILILQQAIAVCRVTLLTLRIGFIGLASKPTSQA